MRHRVFIRGGYRRDTISEAGGEATGPVFLDQDPTVNSQASTKQYVDDFAANIDAGSFIDGFIPVARLPAFAGDLTKAASSANVSITPTGVGAGNYPKVTVNVNGQVTGGSVLVESDLPDLPWDKFANSAPTSLAGYGIVDGLSSTNPSMSGALKVNGPFNNSNDIVNKLYVDQNLVSRTRIGEVEFKITETSPVGYLRANGGEVSKTTYAALYAIIGDKYGGDGSLTYGKPWLQQYNINSLQNGEITGWTTVGNIPGVLYASQALVTKNRVYLLGGWISSGVNVSTIYTAPINADGTLGTWSTAGNLPEVIARSQVFVVKNRVYLITGNSGDGNPIANIHSAIINPNGTLGTWTSKSTTISLYGSQAIVTKNRVYLLGGTSNISNPVSTVNTAPINSDGTLGAWTTAPSLPGVLGWSQAVVTKNRVYLLGGVGSGSVTTAVVYTAPINADGTLGTWTTDTNLPVALRYSQAVVTKNRVYLFGGDTLDGTATSAVYSAPIDTDGVIGTWTIDTPLPGPQTSTQAIVTSSKIYLLGGDNGTSGITTVRAANFSGGSNDYSAYYDGSFTPVTDPSKFRLPNVTSEYFGANAYIAYE